MDFATLPPEINSIRIYSGPGSAPMLAAAAAWDGLAAQLHATAAAYQSTVSRLVGESWLGPASQSMAAAATPYTSWLAATAVQAEQTAAAARAAAAAYEAAFAMTVPPSAVAANRAQLLVLVATNIFGQNAAAIAATEAHYAEMWAQDAAAMYGYAASAAPAVQLTPFTAPPQTSSPAGSAQQTAATAQDTGAAAGAGVQQVLGQLASSPSAAPIQIAPTVAPLPAQEILPDLIGLNAIAVAGLSASDIGIGVSAGAWTSADESTRQILKEQSQLEKVGYDILHNIDLFSPLTPSRPDGFIPNLAPPTSAATGEAISVGRLAVPMNWAVNAPAIRSLAYALPTAGAGGPAAAAAATAVLSEGSAGTAFSQMALAGMGGSALAGSVSRGRQEAAQPPGSVPAPTPEQPPPENPVTGIAAEIREFAELRDRGLISREEYNEQKQRLLGR